MADSDYVEMETGTSSFLDRQNLTKRLEANLEALFSDYGFKVLRFGGEALLPDSSWLRSRLKKVDSKESIPAIMMKFAPDYIVVKESEPKDLFFMDAKASITPVFFQKQVDRIREHYGKDPGLSRSDIGDIEREAWFSYNKLYASRVVVVMAMPYNPKLLLAEWVNKIKCMWCLKASEPGNPVHWDCNECPIYSEDESSFDVMVNNLAAGSGTPHTNIHLGSMRTLKDFLWQDYNVQVDNDEYQHGLLDFIKTWTLGKPAGTVNWKQYNNVIRDLRPNCPWLRNRIKDKFIDYPENPQKSLF